MSSVKDIGFEKNGITYGEDRPCTFDDRCLPTDARLWVQHAGAWLTVLSRRYTPARALTFDRLVRQFAVVGARAQRCRWACSDDVAAAMSIAKYARALQIAWSEQDGVPIEVPVHDLGWEFPWPALPILPEAKAKLDHLKWPTWEQVSDHIKTELAGTIPWGLLLLGVGVYVATRGKRR